MNGRSTNKLSEDTSPYTLRVLKRGSIHIDIDDALTNGFEGTATVQMGNIDAQTFYPIAFVSWDGSGGIPHIIQYYPNQRNEWDSSGNDSKRFNYSIQSTGGSPNKLQLKINAWSKTAILDDIFYYTICSMEAGPRIEGDEGGWIFPNPQIS